MATYSILDRNSGDGSEWESGRIKKWFEDKAFGFVELDDKPGDVFLHITKIPVKLRPSIEIDARVEVVVVREAKGLRAVDCRLE